MKKTILFLLLIMPMLVMGQKVPKEGTWKYLDYKRSFKEFTLGAPIESVSHLIEESESDQIPPGTKLYLVTDPEMKKIADLVEIKELSIITFDDKIAMITMKMDKPNGKNLHKVFSQAYGGGSQVNQFREEFGWKTKNVLMVLDYGGIADDSCIMADISLRSQMQAYEAEQSKKALTDF
jgi:hypothetical protein